MFDQIKQQPRLKKSGSTRTVEVPLGSTIASPGSIVVPPVPAPAPPAAPMRAPLFGARKDVAVTARQQLKQLQWDNMPKVQIDKTIWADSTALDEDAVASLLKSDGVFAEMEEDFKAFQPKVNIAKKAKAQLKSVLEHKARQRIGASGQYGLARTDPEGCCRNRSQASELDRDRHRVPDRRRCQSDSSIR
jgi:hypothetical protein